MCYGHSHGIPVLMALNADDVLDLAEAVRLSRTGDGRAIRLKAGVGASAIAEACDLSVSALTRWELGARRPTGPRAITWVRVLRRLDASGSQNRTSRSRAPR